MTVPIAPVGVYLASPPTVAVNAEHELLIDSAGNLKVNVVVGGGSGGSGSNAAASATGSAVPVDADYQAVNIGGTLVGQTGLALGATTRAGQVAIVDASGNQITTFGSSASVGATGAAVPASADYQGLNIGGNTVGQTGLALGATARAATVAIVDGSGNQITSFGSSASVGATGSAVPASTDYTGLNIGGNAQGLTGLALGATTKAATVAIVDGSGNQISTLGALNTVAANLITRPANTTAYAAQQIVGSTTGASSLLTFTALLRSTTYPGTSGYISLARIVTNQAACTAKFRLWLFNVNSPACLAADQAAFTLLDADKALRLGYLDFPSFTTEGSGSTCAQAILTAGQSNVPLPVMQPNADQNLYGILENTGGAFTPASGQTFWVNLGLDQN